MAKTSINIKKQTLRHENNLFIFYIAEDIKKNECVLIENKIADEWRFEITKICLSNFVFWSQNSNS